MSRSGWPTPRNRRARSSWQRFFFLLPLAFKDPGVEMLRSDLLALAAAFNLDHPNQPHMEFGSRMQASGGLSPVSAPTRSLHSTSTVQTHAHVRWSIDTTRMQDRRSHAPAYARATGAVRACARRRGRSPPAGQIFACVRGSRSSFRRGHSNVVRACPHLQKATHARGDNETPSHGRESLDRRNCQDPGPGARSRSDSSCGATLVADSRRDGRNRSNTRKRSRNPARKERRPGRGPKAWEGRSGVELGTTAEGPGWIFAAAIGGHGEW